MILQDVALFTDPMLFQLVTGRILVSAFPRVTHYAFT
jgi:hypothetical protein